MSDSRFEDAFPEPSKPAGGNSLFFLFGAQLPRHVCFAVAWRGSKSSPSTMRSSRVSRDAARLFDRGSASSTPRRNTRSALAGFAHHAAGPLPADLVTPDIEDGMAASPAKRRRRSYASRASRDVVEADGEGDKHTAAKSSPRRARKPPTPKPAGQAAGSPTASVPPSGWAEVYDAVRAMRSPGGVAHGAAVDTMGCERLADEGASELDRRFQTLVALMLSSQTKDTVNAVAMERLKRELPACREGSPPGLNLDNVLAVDAERLNELIWAVGFHNNKTKSDIPNPSSPSSSISSPSPFPPFLLTGGRTKVPEAGGRDVT